MQKGVKRPSDRYDDVTLAGEPHLMRWNLHGLRINRWFRLLAVGTC